MEKVNLFWAVVWGLVCILAIIGIFWNPSQWATAVICGCFCGAFIWDYVKEKRMK